MAKTTKRMMTDSAQALTMLALDLAGRSLPEADAVWRAVDLQGWMETRDPWATLARAGRTHLAALIGQSDFRAALEAAVAARQAEAARPNWFSTLPKGKRPACIAYFSMEYMLSESLPIYSGGLGNVAGDQLKAASDLGVPVVAVGLLFAQGYFRQEFTPDGRQQALYPANDPGQLPIRPLMTEEGDLLRLEVQAPMGTIWIRAWQVTVGQATLYLLDTNDPANPPSIRCVTSQLYGGNADLRLRQEMVLGIAGWRLLDKLGYAPEVCHLNEGHAALAAVERARMLMTRDGMTFDEALTIARAGTVFTTHTAVPAGFDRFAPDLVASYLTDYVTTSLNISLEAFMALGRAEPENEQEPFNMAWLAIRASGAVNGVSALHGEVSRALFTPLFPRWPEVEVPVGHVTNGIHTPTWCAPEAAAFWAGTEERARWTGTLEDTHQIVDQHEDAALWGLRSRLREGFVHKVAGLRQSRQCFIGSAGYQCLPVPRLQPDVLTLGFARRFATYKRPDLLLTDPDRLARLLTNPDQPMQLVLAGKAHPADVMGQDLIKRWLDFSHRDDVSGRVVFLADYDMSLAGTLVQGVDLWINTPRRPWEACGTSGMKVLPNGGLNLSERDGWWAEAFQPEFGWALGDGQEHGDDPRVDAEEAEALYRLLETEVPEAFYDRDESGIPRRWVAKMRASLAQLTPAFSANRAVRDYTERYYIPAAAAYRRRLESGVKAARKRRAWVDTMAAAWPALRIMSVAREDVGPTHHVAVGLETGRLSPESLAVQLYADPASGEAPEIIAIPYHDQTGAGEARFALSIELTRPAGDYTVRVLPAHAEVMIPLEAPFILWQN